MEPLSPQFLRSADGRDFTVIDGGGQRRAEGHGREARLGGPVPRVGSMWDLQGSRPRAFMCVCGEGDFSCALTTVVGQFVCWGLMEAAGRESYVRQGAQKGKAVSREGDPGVLVLLHHPPLALGPAPVIQEHARYSQEEER